MSHPPVMRASLLEPLTTTHLISVQDSNDSVTPAEAVRTLQASGRSVSRRTVSFWQGQGLVPPADRVGARGGVLPAIVIDLMAWIVDARERGISVNALRELLPLWADLVSGQIRGQIDLGSFERVARSLGLSDEANYQIPVLVDHILGGFSEGRLIGTNIVLKDGRVASADEPLTIKFAVGAVSSDTGKGRLMAWTQLTLPGFSDRPRLADPTLVLLGVPLGVEMEADCQRVHRGRASSRRRFRPQEEALALSYP